MEVKRPLRLTDLWEDDPIGSAGPSVIAPNQLTQSEQREIQILFEPFGDVIHVHQILSALSLSEIKRIKRKYVNNKHFISEFKKRKLRSIAIGEDFSRAQYQEIVWLDLTFKLRTWAIGKGFDSFVYANEKEGNGEDTFVSLLPHQVKETGIYLRFLDTKYLDEMPSITKEMLTRNMGTTSVVIHKGFWGQKDPMVYWEQVLLESQ